MKKFFALVLFGMILNLCCCKDDVVETHHADTKLLLIEISKDSEQKLGMQIPSNWTVTKDSGYGSLRYEFKNDAKTVLYLDVDDGYSRSNFGIEKDRYLAQDSLISGGFGRAVPPDSFVLGRNVLWVSHYFGLKMRSEKEQFLCYRFNYDSLDSVELESVVNSLTVLKSVPEGIYEPLEYIYWYTDVDAKAPSMEEFLCKGCSLQDSAVNQNDTVQYFDCYVDSLSYRYISAPNADRNVLYAVDVERKKDKALRRCRGLLQWEIPSNVGASRERLEMECKRRMSRCELVKNENHWVYHKIDTTYKVNLDSLKITYRHADLFLENDTVNRIHFFRYDEKVFQLIAPYLNRTRGKIKKIFSSP